MERNVRIESVLKKASERLAVAQREVYSDPAFAVKLLNAIDEDIHIATDEICRANGILNDISGQVTKK